MVNTTNKILEIKSKMVDFYVDYFESKSRFSNERISCILGEERKQLDTLKKVFDGDPANLEKKLEQVIESHLSELENLDFSYKNDKDFLIKSSKMEKNFFIIFSLLEEQYENKLTASIFDNFLQEESKHKLILELFLDEVK